MPLVASYYCFIPVPDSIYSQDASWSPTRQDPWERTAWEVARWRKQRETIGGGEGPVGYRNWAGSLGRSYGLSPMLSKLLWMSEFANDLLEIAGRLEAVHKRYVGASEYAQVEAVREAASEVGKAHSGSWLGYHARVYYTDFQRPPAGARFSSEWGFISAFSNDTLGEWQEYTYKDVEQVVLSLVGATLPLAIVDEAERASNEYDELREEVASVFSALKGATNDDYILKQLDEFNRIKLLDQDDYIRPIRPTGQIISRDMAALTAGQHVPPHVSLVAYTVQFTSLEYVLKETARVCRNVARHLQRKERSGVTNKPAGTKIFIGHGHSPMWRDLKDFLHERLHLEYDEFNRVPVAGISTGVRLQEMLDNSRFAFIVMTGEDETAEGTMQARMNVIHEVGLFQGRLGLPRAIVLLEEGCEEFSNIQGLGQIRFPKGNIAAKFEDIRMVLEREGML